MFQPLTIAIGLRYVRAKRRNHFISFISLSSMMGAALGVMALIVVLSVMNGFERELRTRILGMASHATITAYDGMLESWPEKAAVATRHPRVIGVAPYVTGEGMVTNGRLVQGAIIRGIDPVLEPQVSEIADFMKDGSFEALLPGKFNVVLGRALARRIGAGVGTKVTVLAPQARVTPAGVMPRIRRFTVVGLFEVGHSQFDNSLVLMHLEDAAKLYRLNGNVSGVRLKLDELYAAPLAAKQIANQIANEFGGRYFVRPWTKIHENFFKALKTEKTVMFVILTLIVAVAAFNIISTLVMVVTDKQTDIAVLRTLGLTPRRVMGVFMVQGIVIGVVGTALGVFLGTAIALNVESIVPAIEAAFGVDFLNESIYYISEVPSDLRWPDVYKITGVSLILSVLATLYPAWSASRTDPAQALRYE
jgi:lipoprotein-releasing system permease protein